MEMVGSHRAGPLSERGVRSRHSMMRPRTAVSGLTSRPRRRNSTPMLPRCSGWRCLSRWPSGAASPGGGLASLPFTCAPCPRASAACSKCALAVESPPSSPSRRGLEPRMHHPWCHGAVTPAAWCCPRSRRILGSVALLRLRRCTCPPKPKVPVGCWRCRNRLPSVSFRSLVTCRLAVLGKGWISGPTCTTRDAHVGHRRLDWALAAKT